MEEEKAAAYYDELTQKGQGAARFKQGLGFSSAQNDDAFKKQSFSSSSSFLSSFVKASSPTPTSTADLQKQSQLQSIQDKLKKKPSKDHQGGRDRERDSRDRDRERERDSRDRDRNRDRDRDYRDRDRKRDRDRDRDYRDRDRKRDRDGDRDYRDRDRDRDRREDREKRTRRRSEEKRVEEKNAKVDYSRLIEGYDKMTPAERVKAKMKLQLAETAEKDETKGMGAGWERFEFNRDAPLDDEEIEAAEDDAALVKHIGQSFRFAAIEARREEQIKAAHDEAMFGASAVPSSVTSENEGDSDDSEKKKNEGGVAASLLSEKVLAKQQGSWRDRARKA